ncbi:MAG: hypothetical protein NTW55_06620 [Planctomycetota bacterium]|nr:hypothetical protein [Planctomycetota bacterium]
MEDVTSAIFLHVAQQIACFKGQTQADFVAYHASSAAYHALPVTYHADFASELTDFVTELTDSASK